MKKLILLGLLTIGSVIGVSAQRYPYPQQREDRRYEQRHDNRYNNRYEDSRRDRFYIVNEYRYVKIRRDVYKETYRTTYKNGYMFSRYLINRERVYDRHNNFRFGIYLGT